MNKRNVAKGLVAGAYVLTAPIAVPCDLIKCAMTKTTPARMMRNNVDLIEEVLTNLDEVEMFCTRKGVFVKTEKKVVLLKRVELVCFTWALLFS